MILAGAPLGNAADASQRLRDALAAAPVIAAEDTRRLHRLCRDLALTPAGRTVSFFEGNETARVPLLLDALRGGEDVLVVTDAGMPSVSDPGYRLVAAAVAEGIVVTTLPGPSAVTSALAVSGLPVDRFCFEGFLPRKPGERRHLLADLAGERRTLVFFEAPHRLAESLADLADAFGADRPAVVCRELTKTYEEVRRGSLGEIAARGDDVRGEVTLVVAGAPHDAAPEVDPAALAAEVQSAVDGGATRRDAVDQVAARHGLARRVVYSAATARR